MVYFLCKAYDSDRQNCYFAQSLPVRGAWIEIQIAARASAFGTSRSPCGERGLKCLADSQRRFTYARSLPVRGAWIEIKLDHAKVRNGKSLPVRGAWIEISPPLMYCSEYSVAPRAGSVD